MAEVSKFPEGGRPRTHPESTRVGDVVRPHQFHRKSQAPPIEHEPSKNCLIVAKPAWPLVPILGSFKAEPPPLGEMSLSASITVPLQSLESARMTRTWIANMQAAVFDLEKSIARLVKDSDGGSRRIPELRQILQTFERGMAALNK